MKIRDRHQSDRPREKLALYGAARLTDLELLMAIIGSGNKQADVGVIARRFLKVLQAKGADVSYDDLKVVGGLGAAKIPVILASFELARRHLAEPNRPVIDSAKKVYEALKEYAGKAQEHFVMLTLNGANRLINKHLISVGTLTASLVHPREVFAPAIADRAEIDKYSHNASLAEIAENDFNLNIPRYVDTFEPEPEIDFAVVTAEIKQIDQRSAEVDAKIAEFCKELGIEAP